MPPPPQSFRIRPNRWWISAAKAFPDIGQTEGEPSPFQYCHGPFARGPGTNPKNGSLEKISPPFYFYKTRPRAF